MNQIYGGEDEVIMKFYKKTEKILNFFSFYISLNNNLLY
jgi:hypothetical protein